MKFFLPYFIKFSDNKSILSQIYYKDYIIKGLNQKIIIIFIYNENIFFINND